jgi:hypothetical protein
MDRRLFLVVALLAVIGFVVVPAVASAAELSGKVVSADAKANTMVVNDGKDTTVTWTDSTKFTGGKEEDLKAGVMVKVTHEGGKASAIEIVAAKKK